MSHVRVLSASPSGKRWARPAAILLALAVALGFAPAAHAGEEVAFQLPRPEDRGAAPVVVYGTFTGTVSPQDAGGWGYARFAVRNADTRARSVHFSVGGDRVGGSRMQRTLEPGGAATVYLPMLPSENGFGIRVAVEGAGEWWTSAWSGYSSTRRWRVLAIDDREGAKAAVEAAFRAAEDELGKASRSPGSRTAEAVRLGGRMLPDRWPLLSSADAIVVEGGRPGVDAEVQRVLATAVKGGGTLVVLSRSRLPAGPLRDLVTGPREAAGGASEASTALRGTVGLGRWWSTDGSYQIADATRFELPTAVVALVREAVEAEDQRPRADVGRYSTPSGATYTLTRFTDALEVPGIGRVPVRTFFFTILGFALIAGPLSYVLLRRRKRLTAFLVLLPTLGIVFSAAILLYGLLSEGTGIRGSVRSLTILDQRAHEAVTRSGRTLYAAFSPGLLRLDPQTLLLSADFERSSYGYRWSSGTQTFLRLDLTDGIEADGSALPSRIPITYDVTTVAPARERLRFRAVPGGGYEARFAPDFAPTAGERTILLRALDGGWHVGGRDGPLTRIEAKEADDAVRDLLGAVAELPPAEQEQPWDEHGGPYGYAPPRRSGPSPVGPHRPGSSPSAPASSNRWMRGFLPETLPPGSYLALVERAPAFDDLGLDTAWKRSVHLVHGLLSAEDLGE